MAPPSYCLNCGSPMHGAPQGTVCPACQAAKQTPDVGVSSLPPVSGPHTETMVDLGEESAESSVKRIGDYDIHGQIAGGGMGVVYRAHQLSLNRWVALKFIRLGKFATDRELKRFKMEAEAVAALDHPNIVPVYEIGDLGGQPFFSMRLIEGVDLAQLIPRYRKDPRAAVELMVTLARAVHHAHERGVLHRDLKPSNVLIDARGQPYLTDFGLAKLVNADSDLTLSGAVLGTPNYMAPEQAAGKSSTVTTAADVYSLGALLYHLLTGQPPFQAATPAETICQVLDSEPLRPASTDKHIDRELETICLKCLEKEPRNRYPSALAFAEDVDRWLRHEPILATPSSTWERATKWCRRRPALAALLAVSVMAVILVVTVLLVSQHQLRTERDLAQESARAATAAQESSERRGYVATIRAAAARIEAKDAAGVATMLDSCRPELRGWEWGYLSSQLARPDWRHSAHFERILGAQLASEGKRLITTGGDNLIRCWDLETKTERWHNWTERNLKYLSVTPGGGSVLGYMDTGSLLSFEVGSGRILWVAQVDPYASAACLSEDGRFFFQGTEPSNHWIHTYSMADRKKVASWPTEEIRVHWLGSFGSLLIAGSGDSRLRFYEIAPSGTLEFLGDCRLPSVQPRAMALDRVRRRLIVACWRYIVALSWAGAEQSRIAGKSSGTAGSHQAAAADFSEPLKRGLREARLEVQPDFCPQHLQVINQLAADPQHDRLVSASEDGQVRIHPLTGGPATDTLYLDGACTALLLTPAGEIITGEATGTIAVWPPSGGCKAVIPIVFTNLNTGNEISFNSDGTRLLVKGWGEHLGFYDLQRHESREVHLPEMGERLARFRPRHNEVVVGYTNAVRFYQPQDSEWQLLREIRVRGAPGLGRFDSKGDWLALGYEWYSAIRGEGTIDLFRLNTSQRLEGLKPPDATSKVEYAIALSQDGTHLGVVDAWAGRLWLYHTVPRGKEPAWEPVGEIAWGSASGISTGIAFHPREDVLAAGGPAFAIGVWDLAKKTCVRWLRGHRGIVTWLTFSPDGNRLASGSFDHTVRIWDWRLGEELLVLPNKNYYALCGEFSPDGLLLASTDSVPPVWLRTAMPWRLDASSTVRDEPTDKDRAVFDLARRLRSTLSTLAEAEHLLERGDQPKAIELCQDMFALRRELLGDDHPATVSAAEYLRSARAHGQTNQGPHPAP